MSARGKGAGSARRAALALLAAVGLSLAPTDAPGQMVINHGGPAAGRANVVHLRTGMEYAFIAGIGYGRGFQLGHRTLLVSGIVTVPWAEADRHDYGLRAGASIDLLGRDRWRLIGGLGGSVRGTENTISRMTSVGADGMLLGGYWSPGWFVAGEAGYDGAIATHIEHTDFYRTYSYADARDGWYVDTGSNIRLGLVGGLSFRRYDLALRVGQARDREGNVQVLPAYVTVELNLRF